MSAAEPMLLPVGPLPADPLGAAARFHADVLPRVLAALDGGAAVLTLLFEPAGHAHAAWRLAAVQTIACACAPARINAIASADQAAIANAGAYLASAPGVTGQYLVLDSHGAGAVVNSAQ